MSKKVRKYTKEFKAEAIKLALNSVSISDAAKDLGMPEATLNTWVHIAKQSGQQAYQLLDGETGPVHVGELLNENRSLLNR